MTKKEELICDYCGEEIDNSEKTFPEAHTEGFVKIEMSVEGISLISSRKPYFDEAGHLHRSCFEEADDLKDLILYGTLDAEKPEPEVEEVPKDKLGGG